MKYFIILLGVMFWSIGIPHPALSRGQVPPPPSTYGAGLGNAGEWLGSGPIFGFDHPSGPGFDDPPPGGGGNGGGSGLGTTGNDDGYEWTHHEGGTSSESTNCETCRCKRFIERTRKCKTYCACVVEYDDRNLLGLAGYCDKAGVETEYTECCQIEDVCNAVVGDD